MKQDIALLEKKQHTVVAMIEVDRKQSGQI